MSAARAGAWLEHLDSGWRWWLDELGRLVPPAWHRAGVGETVLIVAHENQFAIVGHDGNGQKFAGQVPRGAPQQLRAAIPQPAGWRRWFAAPLILQISAANVLHRPLRLPAASRRDLDDLLRHEVARQSPIPLSEIYYDYRIAARAGATLDIDLRIIRREQADVAIRECREAELPLSAIEFAGDSRRAEGGTFPLQPAALRERRLQARIVPALVCLVLALALALTASVYLRRQGLVEELARQVDGERSRAQHVQGLEDRLAAARRQAVFLVRRKVDPSLAGVLSTVSRLLPDDAWLYEFEMKDGEVRLQGFSASAASLIALFDSSSNFQDAQFRAPLMQSNTVGGKDGLQRFDLSFHLRKKPS